MRDLAPIGQYNAAGFYPYLPSGSEVGFLSHRFGDLRLGKRLSKLRESVISRQQVVIHQLSEAASDRAAYYRLINNERLSVPELLEDMVHRLAPPSPCRHLLLLCDSSEMDYKHLKGRLRDETGLGPMGNGDSYGYYLHPCLGVDAESGVSTGIYDVQIWHQDRSMDSYNGREGEAIPFPQKSSYRWLSGALRSRRRLGKETAVTVVSDRESDIYESMAELGAEGMDFVLRSKSNRVLSHQGGKLIPYVESLPQAARIEVEIRLDRRIHHRAGKRKAKLALRYAPICIQRPYKAASSGIKCYPEQLNLYVVDVKEQGHVRGNPIHWRLITSHKVESVAQARAVLRYYQLRWHIEQLFRILKKQGLQVENLELENGPAIVRMGIIALEAALHILQLNYAAQAQAPIPIQRVFEPPQIEFLSRIGAYYEGNTTKLKNPHPPSQLQWACWIIARLGGWKGYASQRRPGTKTFTIGWRKFEQMLGGAQLFMKENTKK